MNKQSEENSFHTSSIHNIRDGIPHEAILDRVFQDGVRHLAYDPFARLALTIHYYCGTRATETLDLHLFCVLEDQDGHAYLLIPRGKAKQ
ncbi:hypothetical protein, partial [Ktedonobacter racemifer]